MALPVTAPDSYYTSSSANKASGTNQDIGDKQIFLKLLVAQMENQDPLNPSDPTQMSAQLAQFNMVEQQTNTNKLLEQMVANQSSAGSTDSAASYLGKVVTVNQSTIDYSGTPKNFAVDIGANSSSNYLVISDPDGNPIRTLSLGALAAGKHQLSWDGKTDAGPQAPHASYYIDVISADAQGLNVPATVQRSGVVDAVRMTSSGVQLIVGGSPAGLSDVTEIRL